jgi:hypothetical protein
MSILIIQRGETYVNKKIGDVIHFIHFKKIGDVIHFIHFKHGPTITREEADPSFQGLAFVTKAAIPYECSC